MTKRLAQIAILLILSGCSRLPFFIPRIVEVVYESGVDTTAAVQPETLVTQVYSLATPAGLDRSLVAELDSMYAHVLDQDSLQELEEENEALRERAQVVDTVASLVHFFECIANPAHCRMTENDSIIVGSFALEAKGAKGRYGKLLAVDRAILRMRDIVESTIGINRDLRDLLRDIETEGPSRDRLRIEMLTLQGVTSRARVRLDSLLTLVAKGKALSAQLNYQVEVENQLEKMRRTAKKIIGAVDEASKSIRPGSIYGPQTLMSLSRSMKEEINALLILEADWRALSRSLTRVMSKLGIANGAKNVRESIKSIRKDLRKGSKDISFLASKLDTISTFESEKSVREEIISFVTDFERSLLGRRNSISKFIKSYVNSSSEWRKQLVGAISEDQKQIKGIVAEINSFLDVHNASDIRSSYELLATFRSLSDAYLAAEDAYIQRVAQQIDYKQDALARKGHHLVQRANILRSDEEFERALRLLEQLMRDSPRTFQWQFKLANLYYVKADAAGETSRRRGFIQRALMAFDECERLYLKERRDDNNWGKAMEMAGGGSKTSYDSLHTWPKVVRQGYYFEKFLDSARVDLSRALGDLVRDSGARATVHKLDAYRRELARLAYDGDHCLYCYARQLMLSDEDGLTSILENMKTASWDNGNLALADRWNKLVGMITDSTGVDTLRVLRDSLVAIIKGRTIRTIGVSRSIEYQLAAIEYRIGDKQNDSRLEDSALNRIQKLFRDVEMFPCPNPETVEVDSIIKSQYPVFLYSRGVEYYNKGKHKLALYHFYAVADLQSDLKAKGCLYTARILERTSPGEALGFAKRALAITYELLENSSGASGGALGRSEIVLALEVWHNTARRLGMYDEARDAVEVLRKIQQTIDKKGS